jgi:hypothetical protein
MQGLAKKMREMWRMYYNFTIKAPENYLLTASNQYAYKSLLQVHWQFINFVQDTFSGCWLWSGRYEYM